jgi:hypothetical protein
MIVIAVERTECLEYAAQIEVGWTLIQGRYFMLISRSYK